MSWGFEPNKEEKRKRVHVNKKDVIKLHGGVCKVCGKTEKEAGRLEMAHYKAHSKGGNLVFPLCPICHVKYDSGQFNRSELKKIGLKPEEYSKYRPKKKTKKKEPKSRDPFDIGFGLAPKKKGKSKDPFAIDIPDVKLPSFELEPSKKKRRKKKDPFSII